GIEIVEASHYLAPLFVEKGCFTRRAPDSAEERDIEFGWRMTREIGRLDIGQTVVVKSRAVLAVEAIEGTDEAILRGGRLGGEGAVVVKLGKQNQDMRFDVPLVGLDTVKAMAKCGARVLALEAGIVLLIDREETIAFADENGISIVGR
ncbi:MAG: LpxI family protein, partial [Vicinamibacteria bacterium]